MENKQNENHQKPNKNQSMKKIIILLLLVFLGIIFYQDFKNKKKKHTQSAPGNYVVMLSLDGFRWDYSDFIETPNLNFLAKKGVKAEGLQPAFPSKTFPNHYSIATGLYPGNHGLVSNSFYAPDLNKYYAIRDRKAVENPDFYKGEPIWVTAEAQQLKTASYFWVGSETKIKGYHPTIYKKYEQTFPYMQRVDSVISWLSLPYKERPRLITWYLHQPDNYGHIYGPKSKEVKEVVMQIDTLLGVFLQKMQTLSIKDSINFIIVSDHGMTATDSNKVVYLSDYLQKRWIDTLIGSNPVHYIYTKEKYKDSICESLKDVEGLSAWKREDIPERFHLKQSKRIGEVIIVADSTWSNLATPESKLIKGIHGYDNANKDMFGIFFAYGPDFKENYNAGKLVNVDIYNLIAHLLKIQPAPNDGKPERIMHILKDTIR